MKAWTVPSIASCGIVEQTNFGLLHLKLKPAAEMEHRRIEKTLHHLQYDGQDYRYTVSHNVRRTRNLLSSPDVIKFNRPCSPRNNELNTKGMGF